MIVTEPPHRLTSPGVLASGASNAVLRSGKTALIGKRELSRFLALASEAVGLEGEVSVLLTNDETIRRLNRQFRKKNTATDVLSFPPASPPPSAPSAKEIAKRRQPRLAGDLAVSLTTAAQQANAFGHPLDVEVKILLLHGLLHLAGFDHETDRGEMARKESMLRRKLGLPIGLIARSGKLSKPAKKSVAAASTKKVPSGRSKRP